jgi:hypothetical protein
MQILPMLAANGGAIFAGTFGIVLLVAIILAFVFWLWMLVDCLMSTLPSTEKLIWFLVIFFLHVLGALLYLIIARPGGRARVA